MNIAKEYLEQIEKADSRINNRLMQLSDARAKSTAAGGFAYDKIRVKSSGSMDTMAETVTNYVALEKEIDKEIDAYIDLKNRIISEINSIPNVLHIMILGKRYAEYKKLGDIAEELGYSYDHIRREHGRALYMFGQKHKRQIDKYATKCHKGM